MFHGTLDDWNELTDQQRRYVLGQITPDQHREFLLAVHPIGPDTTRDELEERAIFGEQLTTYTSELGAHGRRMGELLAQYRVDRVGDLPAEALEAVRVENERLFGDPNPIMFVGQEGGDDA